MKIAVIGFFGKESTQEGGQKQKTLTLVKILRANKNVSKVVEIDTYGWKKKPFGLFMSIYHTAKCVDTIIMLPASNGLRVFAPILNNCKKKYGNKIIYDVLGGWLPEFIVNKKLLSNNLKFFDGIWVETLSMKEKLDFQGFNNVDVIPNFKTIKPIDESELLYLTQMPFELCMFSRVSKEKGVEDAIEAVKKVNKERNKTVFSLKIYGPIDEVYAERFADVAREFPDYITYCGCIDANQSTMILKRYFALLFPSYYPGEGIPGTLIDAMAAGVPAIASDWRYNGEIITEETGFLFPTRDISSLVDILNNISNNPQLVWDKKRTCISAVKKYLAEECVAHIYKRLNI